MANSFVHPQGWISVNIDVSFESKAKGIRANRDQQYGNIYREAATDARWVGDLGEIVFNSWLKHEGLQGFEWIVDSSAGKPDFITAGKVRIGVKTVKRQAPPKEGYTAQITACHAAEPIDHYFFMTYEIVNKRMWLLGGVSQEDFLRDSKYYSAGEWVHPHYQIRKGHEIHNIELSKLNPPHPWFNSIR